jgi:hypothetical protein
MPPGLAEELALERLAAAEHDRAAGQLWRERSYAAALLARREHRASLARIRDLESEVASYKTKEV